MAKKKKFRMIDAILTVICVVFVAEAAAPAVQAAFAAAGFDSQAWVSPINATGAELLSAT